MSRRLLAFTIILVGLMLATLTAITFRARADTNLSHIMIISSNSRDNDQALYLMTADGILVKKLTNIPGAETLISNSPDGKWLLVMSEVNRNFYSVNITTNAVRQVMDSFGRFVTMSPDSQAVYFTRTLRSSTDALFSISLQDGQPHEIFTHYGYLPPLAISPDGSQLYALIDSLTRIHIPSNTVEPLAYSTTSPSIDILNWSANQEWMVIQEFNDKNYFVYRIRADGQNPQLLLGTARRLRSAHPSPDGLWILVEIEADLGTDLIRLPATGDGPSVPLPMGQFRGWTDNGATFLLHLLENSNQTTLCRMQLATGECLNIIPDVDSVIAQSPTADQILYIHRDQTNQRQYFLVNADSTHQQQIAYGNSIRFGDWSTDGQWLYFDEQDDQHAVLFRINATTGQRQDIHQPYGDNNSHRIFQSFLPLYQTDSSLFGSLILSAALLMIESFLSLPIPRRTGQ